MGFVTEIKSYNKWSFCLTFIIGAICIAFFKFVINLSQIWVTLIPVGLMVGYFIFLPKKNDNLENTNQYGDSLYYLGFLFTLISLSCSLIRFNMINQGVEIIISNLGVALATTICGMVLRIVYLQILDVGFTDEDIRHEFNKTTLQLKEELGNALVDMNLIREQTKIVLGDIRKDFEETHKKKIEATDDVYKSHEIAILSFSKYYKKELTNLIDDVKYFCEVSIQETQKNHQENEKLYTKSASNNIEKLDNVVNKVVESIKGVEDNQSKHVLRLGQTFDAAINSLENFTSNVNKIESVPEEMVSKINDTLQFFDKTVHDVNEKLINNVDMHKGISENFNSISKETKILISEYKNFNDAIKDINSNIEKIEANAINDAIKEYQTTIVRFKTDSSTFIDSFNRSVEKIDEFNNKLSGIKVTPDELVSNIINSFDKIEKVVSKTTKIADANFELYENTNVVFKGLFDESQDLQIQYESFRKVTKDNIVNMESFNKKIEILNSTINSEDISSNFIEYEKSVDLMKKKSQTYLNLFESLQENIQNFNGSIENEMMKSTNYVDQVYKSLLKMTELITLKVK